MTTAGSAAHEGDRVIGAAFWLALIAAFPMLLYCGRNLWFLGDDWSFLAERNAASIDATLVSHNGHWTTTPLLWFRAMFRVVGLHHYLPYQVPVVLLHIGVVACLRAVMERVGVRRTIAVPIALCFLVLGAGATNILSAFQMTLTGSLFCGLAHLLIADRDAHDLRRIDGVGVAVGLVGLTTSATYVLFLPGVFVLCLGRRGVRPALFHALTPSLGFAIWYLAYGRSDSPELTSEVGDSVEYVGDLFFDSFAALGRFAPAGWVLAGIAGFGFYASALSRSPQRLRSPGLAWALALASCWVGFAVSTAHTRATFFKIFGLDVPGRYLHISVALLLPFVGLGLERLISRGSGITRYRNLGLATVAVASLAVGLPPNVAELNGWDSFGNQSATFAAFAHSVHIDDAQADLRPIPTLFSGPTTKWLADNRSKIPKPENHATNVQHTADVHLLLRKGTSDEPCEGPRTESSVITLSVGEYITTSGAFSVVLDGEDPSSPVTFRPTENPAALRLTAVTKEVSFTATALAGQMTVCRN